MKLFELIQLVLRVAVRNLWLYRLRTVIVAALLGFGAFLAVLGLSLLRDVEATMRSSITESVAGDIQIYSNKAKDDLALFGGGFMGRADVGTLPDFAPLSDIALANPNVQAVIPMGNETALLGRGNELDDALDALRAALKAGDAEIVRDRVDQLRFQLQQLERELAARRKLARDAEELDRQAADLATALAPGYLEGIKPGDEAALQFLETRVAPMSGEKQPVYLMYIGTEIGLFRENFPKFHIVEGEALPPGSRGILLGRKFREDMLKNLVARLFDRMHKRITQRGATIKGDDETRREAADLPRQYGQIMSHLDRGEAEALSRELAELGIAGDAAATDLVERLSGQVKSFLTVDDSNVVARRDWFYAHIAPKIRLYEISPGETISLRSYTRSGYVKTLPLKVWGVYSFQGLEDSDLAGGLNIVDLVSFRELYGQMTEASRQELDEMRAAVGIKAVDAASAEDALFGAGSDGALETRNEQAVEGGVTETLKVAPVLPATFDLAEVRQGLALNAAIKLKDPDKLRGTMAELDQAYKAKGYDLRVVDWQTASGIVGQFVNIVRLALVFALAVIFVVALVIITNTIIVSTLNRVREIGTMRAIGAQKTFVSGMFLAETGITGMIGALGGTAAATALLLALGKSGIPAANDVVTFLFSGPRLYPTLSWPLVLGTPLVVTVTATLASIYAARHAAKITPAEAMQEKE